MFNIQLFIIVVIATISGVKPVEGERSFWVNQEKQCFWKDNTSCFQYISGSVHYTRIPYQYWTDRLLKVRAAGLNAIQTYVPWFQHEPEPGQYDFNGSRDLVKFIETAQRLGLYVLLRPGPYIDAEFDMGGFPYWLLRDNPNMKLRTSDSMYLSRVKAWFDILLPLIQPYLYINGGPILMIQVENEYGNYYACDHSYMEYLRDLIIYHVTNHTLLYTTDSNSTEYLKCGTVSGVYPTVDFGPQNSIVDVYSSFMAQKLYSGPGPSVNSEYYPGWLDEWGDPIHHTVTTKRTVKTMKDILSFNNASMNFYMIHGGTNFGYSAGAGGTDGKIDKSYSSVTTSYDYDAPISEAGDPTPKLLAIRSSVEEFTGTAVPFKMPNATKKMAYDSFSMKRMGTVIDILSRITTGFTRSQYPSSAEQLGHGYGFIIYMTNITFSGAKLTVPRVRDRAYFIRNGQEYLGLLERNANSSIELKVPFMDGDILHILLENRGRISDGSWINDSKGISNVTLDGHLLTDWLQYPIELEKYFKTSTGIASLVHSQTRPDDSLSSMPYNFIPSLYVGTLITSDVADTFFDPTNWGKGQLLINGHNLGRYWPAIGPQQTLYVPAVYLNNGSNTVMMLELENPGNCQDIGKTMCSASFTNTPKLSKNNVNN